MYDRKKSRVLTCTTGRMRMPLVQMGREVEGSEQGNQEVWNTSITYHKQSLNK
jgi:hypothetical protein